MNLSLRPPAKKPKTYLCLSIGLVGDIDQKLNPLIKSPLYNDVEIYTTSFSSLVEKDWLSCHICGDFLPTEEGMKVHLNR